MKISFFTALTLVTLGTAGWAQNVRDVWIVDSIYPVAIERLDPIVNPNGVASHMHRIFGSSNFHAAYSYDNYVRAACSSIGPQVDKSAYWVPQLYYVNRPSNGTITFTPLGANVRMYYRLERSSDDLPVLAFPPGLRMLVGNPNQRDAIGLTSNMFTCQKGTGFSNDLYSSSFNFNTDCPGGLKTVIAFPQCWDGINLYKADGSHMKKAGTGHSSGGNCPFSHPYRLPSILFEIIWHINSHGPAIGKALSGNLAWANGDTLGYGAHADFVSGWDMNVLTAALKDDRCTRAGLTGSTAKNPMQMQECPVLAASFNDDTARKCTVDQGKGEMQEDTPKVVRNPSDRGHLPGPTIPKLPGCNPLWLGTGAKPTCASPPFTPDVSPYRGSDQSLIAATQYQQHAMDLPATGGWKSYGCSDGTGTIFKNQIQYNDETNSISTCRKNCQLSGFRFAAAAAKTCKCGTGLADDLRNVRNQCTDKCAGNSAEICGGPGKSSIWYAAPDLALPSGTGRGGCYVPPFNGKEGFEGVVLSTTTSTSMTASKCQTTCRQGGFKWAATQSSNICNCGDVWRPAGGFFSSLDQKRCNTPCTGNPNEICGKVATNYYVVYSLVSEAATSGATAGTPIFIAMPTSSSAANATATRATSTTMGSSFGTASSSSKALSTTLAFTNTGLTTRAVSTTQAACVCPRAVPETVTHYATTVTVTVASKQTHVLESVIRSDRPVHHRHPRRL